MKVSHDFSKDFQVEFRRIKYAKIAYLSRLIAISIGTSAGLIFASSIAAYAIFNAIMP